MFSKIYFSGRYALLVAMFCWFVIVSFLLRVGLLAWETGQVSMNLFDMARTVFTGLLFDVGAIVFFLFPAMLYLTLLPNRLVGSKVDRFVNYVFGTLTIFLLLFSFLAEITFWEEFRTRFNFIAVDYLIYTHEVVANIRQSYPLTLLIGLIVLLTAGSVFWLCREGIFQVTFKRRSTFLQRIVTFSIFLGTAVFYAMFITNSQAEWSANRYNSEISKSGIYSLFAAFRNNRMDYDEFYTTIAGQDAFRIVREKLTGKNSTFTTAGFSIHRTISPDSISSDKKNVVFILTESLSAKFMAEFGNDEKITPFLDSLAQKSLFFNNLYATGTRTVRGMEAVTLCIPPTPGQSIVKRPENGNLFTVSNVFTQRKYSCNFFYGGDGYFDNMNAYFGGNGFDIYDRGTSLEDDIKTVRHHIGDSEVTFENAWGICDEDIFNTMIRVADEKYRSGKPFFNFVMTTSNHRPYTYPSGKIDIASGSNRQGAVKYTDYAFREMFRKAKTKPWFKNTVFVIIADHCASSAGKDEIDVANYHIPAFIVNAGIEPKKVGKLCSQIDVFPTLFSLFKWKYESDFFGSDVLSAGFKPRAVFGTYRKLCLMKRDSVMVLSDQKKQNFYRWNASDNALKSLPQSDRFLSETISWYQTADYLFTNKLLK
ncbi:MAG: alkaline phosphatase family protein [Flavobacterium sp.]|uniref:LTA synthase family protein n=1 Tax=Flavobacterium sp. TaxID=239 RepID=UPI001228A4E7|nr:alkaline phosphatase family protein [Flavobacterium sp.]RZJ64238.1 MAG: alkaline phosphatase family protein [Flavobacterium sp.]